jgi:hypothetical protein
MSNHSFGTKILCHNCGFTLGGQIKSPISPTPDIIGTYDAPTGLQKYLIRKAIKDGKTDLARLDTEITQVQALLDQLLLERQALVHHVDIHQTLLSPMRRLPSELISEIFFHCLPDEICPLRAKRAPLILGMVCRAWRTIALSTPKLWSRLELLIYRYYPWRITKECLARAKMYPLSIALHVPGSTPDNKWIEMLRSSYKRWQHLELHLYAWNIDNIFPSKPCFEQLRTLTIRKIYHDPDGMPEVTFEEAPMLRTVNILEIGAMLPLLRLPWHQLTCVCIICDVYQFIEVLHQCPALAQCSFLEKPARFNSSGFAQVHMTQLHTLSIHLGDGCPEGVLESILDALTLPALRCIRIRGMLYLGMQFELPCHFSSFFVRSGCHLQSLHLSIAIWTNERLLSILALVPGLAELDIDCSNRSQFATYLALDHQLSENHILEISNLLPNLERLTFCCDEKSTTSLFIQFIQSRWDTMTQMRQGIQSTRDVAQLRNVRLRPAYSGTVVGPCVFSWAERLRAEGLDILIPGWFKPERYPV